MQRYVFLSNALSGTISRYQITEQNAQVRLDHLGDTAVGEMVMPMAVNRQQTQLYTALRSEPFCVARFAIDRTNGDLKLIDKTSLAGSMANLAIDARGKWLLGASFNQQLASLNAINDQGVIDASATTLPTNGACHCILASQDNRWLISTEFESDLLNVYRHPSQANGLQKVQQVATSSGSGPRHLVFSPDQSHVYVLHEMSASVASYRFDSQTGQLHFIAQSEALPLNALGLAKGLRPSERIANDIARAWAADIQITPNGRFIYISERTLSVMACLEVSPTTQRLRYVGHQRVERQPRSFAISQDGRYMLVSGELSDSIGLYAIDRLSGKLTLLDSAPCGEYSAWVSVVEYA